MPRADRGGRLRRGVRIFSAVVSLGLAAWSVAHNAEERRSRGVAERFARRFTLDLRRPLDVETMRLEPAGDLASAAVADAALRDAEGDVPKGLTPHLRRVWLEAISRRDEELADASGLMLEAIAARPGWAYHRNLLGRLNYAATRESPAAGAPAGNGTVSGMRRALAAAGSTSRNADSLRLLEVWAKPLSSAAAGAPGVDAFWWALGEAYLESWPRLPPGMRGEVPPVLRQAFVDAGFVSRQFLAASAALGSETAVSLLPEAAKPLASAVEALAETGDITGAALLFPRAERAERKSRRADLSEIERRLRYRHPGRRLSACYAWVSDHPIGDFDDREGRTQVARLLELWPNGRIGDWSADPRGDLVRFFLNGRERHVKGEVMARALEALSDVPLPVKGRVDLLAGDGGGAEALARQSETEGSLEWTGFLIELARFEAKRGRARQARIALERLPREDYEECDSLLVRREVARALGDSVELEAVNRRLRWPTASFRPEGGWSASGTLALCVDPEQSAERLLTVEVVAEGPALVAYGWDGGRLGTVLVQRNLLLRLPLRGLSGRRNFSVRSLFGGPARLAGAFITGVS